MPQLKGYRPSPPGKMGLGAIYGLKLAAVPLPKEALELLPPAWSQSFSDCVANSSEVAIRHGQWVKLGRPTAPWPYLAAWPEPGSRAWLYAIARVGAGQSLEEDDGTFIHSLFEGVGKLGFPKESQWTYGPEHLHAVPPWKEIRESADQAFVAGAHRIISSGSSRVLDVATAIAGGSVVVWGTELDQAFEDLGPHDVWPGVTGPTIGGHAMALHGFRTSAAGRLQFASRSSWDSGFADFGSAWVDEDAIASRRAEDFWVVSNAPLFSGTA